MIYRVLVLALAVMLWNAASSHGDEKPVAPPAATDIRNNPLVQKALADQEKAKQVAEEEFSRKLEVIKAERQKKLDAANTACVAALRRAESVATTRNNKEEALTIKALADSMTSEISTNAAATGTKIFVGRWEIEGLGAYVLGADGTAQSRDGTKGKWAVNYAGHFVEIRWESGWTDRITQLGGRKWVLSHANPKSSGTYTDVGKATPPASVP